MATITADDIAVELRRLQGRKEAPEGWTTEELHDLLGLGLGSIRKFFRQLAKQDRLVVNRTLRRSFDGEMRLYTVYSIRPEPKAKRPSRPRPE